MLRPIRFGLIAAAADASELIQTAQAADGAGYSTIGLNDHFNSTVAPLVGLQAMAGATSRLRLSTAALNQDLRHPRCWPRKWLPSTSSLADGWSLA
ncbi:LLM class flavin-dependent oxidoreductase [Mycobacterium botniense]|uniref:LLM class flavin-dependent oxidoreductase n=1 Tax=Mycobacterium botniense TaxID=84962 RepID=UPI0013D0BB8A